jgi:predicted nucleic acid-binding protein
MRKIFLDANVLVSVFNKEYPLFSYSSRVLSLADDKKFELFTSPICLAIAFYFAEKKSGPKMAIKKIQLLITKIKIANSDGNAVMMAAQNKAITDFEDGLEYYSAINAGCQCIITEDVDDFHFSGVEVLRSQHFLEQYALR